MFRLNSGTRPIHSLTVQHPSRALTVTRSTLGRNSGSRSICLASE